MKRPLPKYKIVWRCPTFGNQVDVEFPGLSGTVRITYIRQFGYRYQVAFRNGKEIAREGGWKGIIRAVHKLLSDEQAQTAPRVGMRMPYDKWIERG